MPNLNNQIMEKKEKIKKIYDEVQKNLKKFATASKKNDESYKPLIQPLYNSIVDYFKILDANIKNIPRPVKSMNLKLKNATIEDLDNLLQYLQKNDAALTPIQNKFAFNDERITNGLYYRNLFIPLASLECMRQNISWYGDLKKRLGYK